MADDRFLKDMETILEEGGLTQEEYQELLSYLDSEEITVLRAELSSGVFSLIYNSNIDYNVKMPNARFREFAEFFGMDQIHPDDRGRYYQEIRYWHDLFYEHDRKKHSIYSRMLRPSIGEYQMHEFVTIHTEMGYKTEQNLLLICRPIKTELSDKEPKS